MRRNELLTTTAVAGGKKHSAEIKVTIHLPDNVSDAAKQQKINRLYDLLKPKHGQEDKKNVA